MKKITPFIISPMILILCDLVFITTNSAILLTIVWFSRLLIIPIVHFTLIRKYVQSNYDVTEKWRAYMFCALSALFVLVIVIFESWLVDYVVYDSRLFVQRTVFRCLWSLLIGVVVLSLTMISTFCNDKRIFKAAVIAESVAALGVNVFLTYYLPPIMGTKYAVDTPEVITLITGALLVGVLSYFVGGIISNPLAMLKLGLWLVGILVSEFASMWIVEFVSTPFHWLTLSIWLIVSILAFAPCLIKYLTNSKKSAEAA